jgi:hypothetical protein
MFPENRFGVTVNFGAGQPYVYDNRLGDLDWREISADAIILTYMDPGFRFNSSLSVGAFLRIPLEEVFSFQPEIRYMRQTSRGRKGELGTLEFETNSIRLPMMFRFTNNYAKRNLMPYAEIGPVVDINSGAYWHSDYDDRKRSLSTVSVGVAIGGGAEYYISACQAAYLGARFGYVTNIGRERDYNLKTFELVAGFSLFSF